MYNLSPAIRAAWDDLFVWLAAQTGISLEIVAHAAPAPLSDLWARPDMGAVFMCGYPWSRLAPDRRPRALAAPVSSESWAAGGPRYASHILVAADGPIATPSQLLSARWGWTVRDSQSGYHAPRVYLAAQAPVRQDLPQSVGPQDLPQAVGPLLNPTGIVEALLDGRIEAGAIDAYAYQLLSMHDPDRLSGLRIVATTASVPAPMLVAARDFPADQISALGQALLQAHLSRAGGDRLARLGLLRWSAIDPADYDELTRSAGAADAALGFVW